MTIRPTWTLAVVTSLLAGCGGSEPGEQRPAPNPLLHPEQFAEISPATFQVLFETSVGDFVVEVHREWAPLGGAPSLLAAWYGSQAPSFRAQP